MAGSSSARESSAREPGQRFAALLSNSNAIRAVAAAVEGTLGPKGLNCMLVDRAGDVTITNDGSTILSRIDASHPAARILIRAARAQDNDVGDGTTTFTVLTSALINEGVSHALRGVPIPMLVDGIRAGVAAAAKYIESHALLSGSLEDQRLRNAVVVAARGESAIAAAVLDAAVICGSSLLQDANFDLRDSIIVQEGAETEAFSGILIQKDRLNRRMPTHLEDVKCLILDDALEPEALGSEALATDRGFSAYLEHLEQFKKKVDEIVLSGVGLVIVQKGVHDIAEEKLTNAGCIVFRRVGAKDLARTAEHTGSRVLKRSGLMANGALDDCMGRAKLVKCDDRQGYVVIRGGAGEPAATVLIGASTREVADEVKRIAEDACGALQTALSTGLVAGGGAIELAAAGHVRDLRSRSAGMSAYGLDCVAEALKMPLAQIVSNAGYNPLEKIEEAVAAQDLNKSASLGIDCGTGEVRDMLELGVWDPAGVKLRALRGAAEVAEGILRINSIARRQENDATGVDAADVQDSV